MGGLLAEMVDPVECADGVAERAAAGDEQYRLRRERVEVGPQPGAEARVVIQAAADLDDDHGRLSAPSTDAA